MTNLLIVGCGHMGEAILVSLIKSKKYKITVIDPKRYYFLNKKYKNKSLNIIKSIDKLKKNIKFNFVLLAVKPIDIDNVLKELLLLNLGSKVVLVSIIAGKKIQVFQKKLTKIKNIFRIMPNIPALIGHSMNCIVSSKSSSNKSKQDVDKLFSYCGKNVFLKNENEIDMSTAISGSGPGFVFNLIDAMEKAAINLGFKENIAKILVSQTFEGSINLIQKSNNSASELVNMVATKGGTTEAGLNIMKKNKLHKIFINLTKASYKKAKDQGNKNAKR
tara:strand:+ start:245 stop:1069 length:825 start_codon:yes stop_codon:yes gene_type:complete